MDLAIKQAIAKMLYLEGNLANIEMLISSAGEGGVLNSLEKMLEPSIVPPRRVGLTGGMAFSADLGPTRVDVLFSTVELLEAVANIIAFDLNFGVLTIPDITLQWVDGQEPFLTTDDPRLVRVLPKDLALYWRVETKEMYLLDPARGPVLMRSVAIGNVHPSTERGGGDD
jgi:hypothetical protein